MDKEMSDEMYEGVGEGREKRKVFRLDLKPPLCIDLTIAYLNDQPVQTGYTKVCATNLSARGFSFSTKLSFPVKSGVTYNF
ncbi:MAG TPA: hypothetical protein DCP90_00455 [Clostridiales bacterium]|nr:MAG: hypothetical protein A2Y22_08170 [Clostridiales bacterium GWD2_32_59]HAN09067.1 hypothetical protein [Clostridiales bacterium]